MAKEKNPPAAGEMSKVKSIANEQSKAPTPNCERKVDGDWAKYPCTDEPSNSGH